MPTYDLKNTKTGEIKEYVVSISKKEEMVSSGEYEQLHTSVNPDNFLSRQFDGNAGKAPCWQEMQDRLKTGHAKIKAVRETAGGSMGQQG